MKREENQDAKRSRKDYTMSLKMSLIREYENSDKYHGTK